MTRDPHVALEAFFGFRKFLHGQERVVSALLSGQDALVVMPTGGGKSLCYQLPAMIMEGVTIVISPLIALMKDQVDALVARKIPATMINSSVSGAEQQARIRGVHEGQFKLVYVAPERFRSPRFLQALSGVPIALFAVDEAHCLSQWGHDFRPDYLRLGQARQHLGNPQTLALTATATPTVRSDILTHLHLKEPFQCVTGFERPNLSLTIKHVDKKTQKLSRLKQLIKQHQTGIIYCATRKSVDELSERLDAERLSVIPYHGGMTDQERSRAQDLFLRRERNVAVATNAFGMGIDRPDVRFVAHYEVPGSVEAYYQEAGRAGRDGEPSACELLFNYADTRTQEFFIEGNNPSPEMIQQVYKCLLHCADPNQEVRMPLQELAKRANLKNTMGLSTSLSTLARHRYVERFDIAHSRMRGTRLLKPHIAPNALQLDWETLREKERRDRAKLRAMVDVCYDSGCRQQAILRYFGESTPGVCGTCDRCRAQGGRDFREPGEGEALIVRKALSGVARMSRRQGGEWAGRYGRGRIIQMLVGSRSQEILQARLDELSTYGLLKDLGTAYLNALFREMQEVGLVTVSSGQYPILTLTRKGEEVMRGQTTVWRLRWPDPSPAKAKTSKGEAGPMALNELGFDQALFEKLRAKRAEMAVAANLPEAEILPNSALEFFTRLRPTSIEAACRIRGVSPTKHRQYLDSFVTVLKEHS